MLYIDNSRRRPSTARCASARVLPILGSLVLGVLREIAVRPGRLELLRQLERELVLQFGQLPLEAGEDGSSMPPPLRSSVRPTRGARSRSLDVRRSAPRSVRAALHDRAHGPPTGVDATSRIARSSFRRERGGTYAFEHARWRGSGQRSRAGRPGGESLCFIPLPDLATDDLQEIRVAELGAAPLDPTILDRREQTCRTLDPRHLARFIARSGPR